jgi:hypothetical protein
MAVLYFEVSSPPTPVKNTREFFFIVHFENLVEFQEVKLNKSGRWGR